MMHFFFVQQRNTGAAFDLVAMVGAGDGTLLIAEKKQTEYLMILLVFIP